VIAALICAIVGASVAGDSAPSRAVLLLAGTLGGIAVLSAAVIAPRATVAMAFLLLGVVRIEPAPSDGIFLLAVAASVATGWYRRPIVPAVVGIPLAAFALVQVLALTAAQDLSGAIRYCAITLYLIATGVWLTGVLADRGMARLALRCYVIGAVAAAAIATLAVIVRFPGFEVFTYIDGSRAKALFKDPNVFGPFLIPAALILLQDTALPRALGWSRRICAPLFFVAVIGVVFSFSRGAQANLALGIAVVVAVALLRRGDLLIAMRVIAVLVGVGLVGLVTLTATGNGEFLAERSQGQAYDTVRFSNQREAAARATEHVFGSGPGSSNVELEQASHSMYAQAAFETGVLGAALLLAILLATTVVCARLVMRRLDVHGVDAATLLGAWLGILLNAAVVDTVHWRHMWVVAALIWLGAAAQRDASGRVSGGRTPSRASTSSQRNARLINTTTRAGRRI